MRGVSNYIRILAVDLWSTYVYLYIHACTLPSWSHKTEMAKKSQVENVMCAKKLRVDLSTNANGIAKGYS